MLYQLHWQNRANFRETEFIAQDECHDQPSAEAMHERFRNIIERRKDECPEGWGPMICDENYELFARAALLTTITTPKDNP